MGGDYTRFTFDPRDNHAGVLMQQGRVQLDADWNELVEILDRRLRAETVDIIGRAVVPRETPDAFRIDATGGTLSIGAGRMYVHGLLAENHGAGNPTFDPILAETHYGGAIDYAAQPYLPNPPDLPQRGPHVVYLDVWQREVTWLEDPNVLEKAVGVDTATRVQTVWQVKLLDGTQRTVTCATPDGELPGWDELTRPSDGRLTSGAVGIPDSEDPCYLSPTGGYRGQQNRLYRVEIHDGGPLGEATFKWSRDNGAVASAVTAISANRRVLTVTRTGRDRVLRFDQGDWVEITDDWLELAGQPGVMARVADVDDAEQTVTLETALPAGTFPTTGIDNLTDADRHTRIRRWDQSEALRDPDGNEVAPVSATNGLITVPAAATELVLEDGVSIELSLDRAGGRFRSGDYWVFAARTVDASVEELDEAPPRGIHHHYARLAVVTFPETESDCREFWPPEFGGDGCDCDRCVTPESHASGALTIQRAIDEVKDRGGKVCLAVGIYDIGDAPILVTGARSLRLVGKGWQSMIVRNGTGPAIIVENSTNVTVEELTAVTSTLPVDDRGQLDALAAENGAHMLALLLAIASRTPGGPAVLLRNCNHMTLRRCLLAQGGFREGSVPCVALTGFLMIAAIHDNLIMGSVGIGALTARDDRGTTLAQTQSYLMTAGLSIASNYIAATRRGVSLHGFSLHMGDTGIRGNTIVGTQDVAINATGAILSSDVAPQAEPDPTTGAGATATAAFSIGSRMEISGNLLTVRGDGIAVGTDDARVNDNDISGMNVLAGADGIVLGAGLDPTGIDRAQVLGNRISAMTGSGISLRNRIRSAMIKMNVITATGTGIVMDEDAEAGDLCIDNNQLLDLAPGIGSADVDVVGIRVVRVDQGAIVGNSISRLGRTSVQSRRRVAIQAALCDSVRVAGNEVVDLAPAAGFVNTATGIDILGPFGRVDVGDNAVRRSGRTAPQEESSRWTALVIRTASLRPEGVGSLVAVPVLTQSTTNPTTGLNLPPQGLIQVIAVLATKVVVLPPAAELVGARGNLLTGYGSRPMVTILGRGPCTFSDNRCIQHTGSRTAQVQLAAGALVASANYVQGLSDVNSVELLLPGTAPFTILGNISSGPIRLNNAQLPSPWSALNVIGT